MGTWPSLPQLKANRVETSPTPTIQRGGELVDARACVGVGLAYPGNSYCTLLRLTLKRAAKRWRFSVFQPLCVPGITWTSTSFTPVVSHHFSLRKAASVDQKRVILPG